MFTSEAQGATGETFEGNTRLGAGRIFRPVRRLFRRVRQPFRLAPVGEERESDLEDEGEGNEVPLEGPVSSTVWDASPQSWVERPPTLAFSFPPEGEDLQGLFRRHKANRLVQKMSPLERVQYQRDCEMVAAASRDLERKRPRSEEGADYYQSALRKVIQTFVVANHFVAKESEVLHAVMGIWTMINAERDAEFITGMSHAVLGLWTRFGLASTAEEFLMNCLEDRSSVEFRSHTVAEIWELVTKGAWSRAWPTWLRNAVSLCYKMLGLGIVASFATTLVPRSLLDWAKRWSPNVDGPHDLVKTIEDSATDLIRRVKTALAAGALSPLFEPILGKYERTYVEAMTAIQLPNDALPVVQLPGENYYSVRIAYILEVSQRVEKLSTSLSPLDSRQRELARVMASLMVRSTALMERRSLTAGRRQPISFTVLGEPGVGKTCVIEALATAAGASFGWDPASSRYTLTLAVDYHDDMETDRVKCIVWDDVGCENPDKSVNPTETVKKIIGLINSVPMEMNADKLENKGRIFANPDVVIMTTNDPSLGVAGLAANPAAIARRVRDWIQPSVREAWREPGTSRIDWSRVKPGDEPFEFQILTTVPEVEEAPSSPPQETGAGRKTWKKPRPPRPFSLKLVATLGTVAELMNWARDKCQAHIKLHEKVVSAGGDLVSNVVQAWKKDGSFVDPPSKRSQTSELMEGLSGRKGFSSVKTSLLGPQSQSAALQTQAEGGSTGGDFVKEPIFSVGDDGVEVAFLMGPPVEPAQEAPAVAPTRPRVKLPVISIPVLSSSSVQAANDAAHGVVHMWQGLCLWDYSMLTLFGLAVSAVLAYPALLPLALFGGSATVVGAKGALLALPLPGFYTSQFGPAALGSWVMAASLAIPAFITVGPWCAASLLCSVCVNYCVSLPRTHGSWLWMAKLRGSVMGFWAQSMYQAVKYWMGDVAATAYMALLSTRHNAVNLANWPKEDWMYTRIALYAGAAYVAFCAVSRLARERREEVQLSHGRVVASATESYNPSTLPKPSEIAKTEPGDWQKHYNEAVAAKYRDGEVVGVPRDAVRLPSVVQERLELDSHRLFTKAVSTSTSHTVMELTRAQTYSIVVTDCKGVKAAGLATLVNGTAALTSAHLFAGDAPWTVEVRSPSAFSYGLVNVKGGVREGSGLAFIGTRDAAIVLLPVPAGRDLVKYFAGAVPPLVRDTPVQQICRAGEAPELHSRMVTVGGRAQQLVQQKHIGGAVGGFDGVWLLCDPRGLDPKEGNSGGMAVCQAPTGADCAFVCGPLSGVLKDASKRPVFALVLRNELLEALNGLGKHLLDVPSLNPVSVPVPVLPAISISHTSWLMQARDGSPGTRMPGEAVGRIGLGMNKVTGRVVATRLAPRIRPLLEATGVHYGRPPTGVLLVAAPEGLRLAHPVISEQDKFVANDGVDPVFMRWATWDYFQDLVPHIQREMIRDGLNEAEWRDNLPTWEDVAFGSVQFGIKPVNYSTSAGPFTGQVKRDLMDPERRWIDPALIAACEETERELLAWAEDPQSQVTPLLAQWTGKFELLSVSKLDDGKTRYFLITYASLLLVMKKYLCAFLRGVHRAPFHVKEMAIGVNAMDPTEWYELFEKLFEMDWRQMDRFGATDVKGLDLNHRLEYARHVGGEIFLILEEMGIPLLLCRMIAILFVLPCCAAHVIDGVVMMLICKFLTGILITGEYNSIFMSVLFRACFALAYWRQRQREGTAADMSRMDMVKAFAVLQANVPRFRPHVGLRVYGDDNQFRVARQCTWFDSVVFGALAREYGFVVTPASDKSGDLAPFISLEETTFLKRGIVLDAQFPIARAPLAVASVLRPLVWSTCEDNVPEGPRDTACAENAVKEAWAHGRAFYDQLRAALPEPFEDGVYRFNPHFLSYDEITKLALQGNLRTWDGGGQDTTGSWEADNPLFEAGTSEVAYSSGKPLGEGSLSVDDAPSGVKAETGVLALVDKPRGLGVPHEAPGDILPESQLATWLDRWETVYYNANVGSAGVTVIYPLTLMLALPVVLRKLANQQLLTADALEISVQVLGNPTTMGLLKVALIPGGNVSWIMSQQDGGTTPITSQVFQMRGPLFDMSQAETIILSTQCVTPYGPVFLPGTSAMEPLATPNSVVALGFYAVKNAQDVTLTTPKNIGMLVRCRLRGARLAGPTSFTYTTVSMDQSGESRQGSISTPATMVSEVAGAMSELPVIGPYASVVAAGAEVVAGVASALGYSAPLSYADTTPMELQPYSQMASFVRRDNMPSGSNDPKVGVAAGTEARLSVAKEDPMLLASIIRRPGIVYGGSTTFSEWTTAAGNGSVIGSIPVSPVCLDSSVAASCPSGYTLQTPIGYASLAFQQWTGSLVYRFKFAACPFVRGRIAIYYEPQQATAYSGQTQLTFDPLSHYGVEVDLEQQREVCLEVGWHSFASTLAVVSGYSAGNNAVFPTSTYGAPAGSYLGCCNGLLLMQVTQPLTGAQSSGGVGIVVTVEAGPDFALAYPSPSNAFHFTPSSGPVVASFDDGAPNTSAGRDFGPGAGAACLKLVPGRSVKRDLSLVVGENYTSLRQLLNVAQYMGSWWAVWSPSATATYCGYARMIIPMYLWTPSSGTAFGQRPLLGVPPTGVTTGVSGFSNTSCITMFEYFRPAFVGMSGSTKFWVAVDAGVSESTSSRGIVGDVYTSAAGFFCPNLLYNVLQITGGWSGAAGYNYEAVPFPGGPNPNTSGAFSGLTIWQPGRGQPVKTAVPFRSTYRYIPTNWTEPTTSTSTRSACVFLHQKFGSAKPTLSTDPYRADVFFSIGEDFTFLEFLCCPLLFLQ